MTWDEVKNLKSIKAGFSPITFDEYAKNCEGKFDLMIDVKSKNKSASYYNKLREILEKYNLMENLVFIDDEAQHYFWGEARFSIRVKKLESIYKQWKSGADVAANYFLFDHGMELNALAIRLAQKMSMEVIPTVNIQHYKFEDYEQGARRDIKFCRSMGVTAFQIDSDFDVYFDEDLKL